MWHIAMWEIKCSVFLLNLPCFYLVVMSKIHTFATQKSKKGSLAEWLGTGLQNRLRRFESARNLKLSSVNLLTEEFFYAKKSVFLRFF